METASPARTLTEPLFSGNNKASTLGTATWDGGGPFLEQLSAFAGRLFNTAE